MKTILRSFVLTMFFFSMCYQVIGQSIKEKKVYEIRSKGSTKDSVQVLKSHTKYNEYGDIVSKVTFCDYCKQLVESGYFFKKVEYVYDSRKKLTEEKYYAEGNENPWMIKEYENTLNDKGQIIFKVEKTRIVSGNIKSSTGETDYISYSYNQSGNIAKVLYKFTPDGKGFKHRDIYIYNENQWLKRIETTHAGKKNKKYKVYEYDSVGNRISYKNIQKTHLCGSYHRSWQKEFDEKKRMTKRTICLVEGSCLSSRYEYDDHDRLKKKMSLNSDGKPDSWDEYFYNLKGDLERVDHYSYQGIRSFSEYMTYEYF